MPIRRSRACANERYGEKPVQLRQHHSPTVLVQTHQRLRVPGRRRNERHLQHHGADDNASITHIAASRTHGGALRRPTCRSAHATLLAGLAVAADGAMAASFRISPGGAISAPSVVNKVEGTQFGSLTGVTINNASCIGGRVESFLINERERVWPLKWRLHQMPIRSEPSRQHGRDGRKPLQQRQPELGSHRPAQTHQRLALPNRIDSARQLHDHPADDNSPIENGGRKRRGRDSNPRWTEPAHNGFRDRRIQPLCHPSRWCGKGSG